MSKKYSTGLVIGRFQPFHNGHDYLIKQALGIADNLIIGIGSSNIKNNDNPLSYLKRKKIINIYIKKKKLEKRINKIIPLPDCPDDDIWFEKTIKKTGKIDMVFGNNNWVNNIFKKKKIKTLEFPYYKRYIYEGSKIRSLILRNKKWENRVPGFLIDNINSVFLRT